MAAPGVNTNFIGHTAHKHDAAWGITNGAHGPEDGDWNFEAGS